MGEGPHVGIEGLAGVQMLPQKSFYPKVLEGGQGDFFQEVPPHTPRTPRTPINPNLSLSFPQHPITQKGHRFHDALKCYGEFMILSFCLRPQPYP